ncbi:MAG: 4-hydroxybenzoate octaprenyltransferase [Porticoccaceae bacterium]|nr:4-hydroxybenzoate octaprenyltransferase [Gammaproteobacteria bacterium]TAL05316.1 MAG: 4-hydroxybenzoate octaprenyltransferase [Porticoccaceae bacterium]
MQTALQRMPDFARLMRLDRPIGTLLLLWPTLWSLWFAAGGMPDLDVLTIFVLGVALMRAAGCVINDYADRNIDGAVARTRDRPLATGRITPREALRLFVGLCLMAFLLVLLTNRLTVLLSLGGAALAALYPFAKRHTHLPQFVLGAAWAWSIPMAFAAQTGTVPTAAWSLYAGVVLWTVAFDTYYAMVDRDDDLKLGVKSTAILFGTDDLLIIGALQVLALLAFALAGSSFGRGLWYYLGLGAMALWFFHQHRLARQRDRGGCFRAFLGNNRAGATLFLFMLLDYHWPLGPG